MNWFPHPFPESLTVDDLVDAFEQAARKNPDANLLAYAPPPGHPLRLEAMTELVRVDMELSHARQTPRGLDDYQRLCPDVFDNDTARQAVAFEDFRLRLNAKANPDPLEYQRRFAVDISDWLPPGQSNPNEHLDARPAFPANTPGFVNRLPDNAHSERACGPGANANANANANPPDRLNPPVPPGDAGHGRNPFLYGTFVDDEPNVSTLIPIPVSLVPSSPVPSSPRADAAITPATEYPAGKVASSTPADPPQDPAGAGQGASSGAEIPNDPTWKFSLDVLEEAAVAQAMPEVGEIFLEFHLTAELGRGKFGRVFLAQQTTLAGRYVALKVVYAAADEDESQTLARLHHNHIVPIHSVHRRGPLAAICMPFFGQWTLDDILRQRTGHPLAQSRSWAVWSRSRRSSASGTIPPHTNLHSNSRIRSHANLNGSPASANASAEHKPPGGIEPEASSSSSSSSSPSGSVASAKPGAERLRDESYTYSQLFSQSQLQSHLHASEKASEKVRRAEKGLPGRGRVTSGPPRKRKRAPRALLQRCLKIEDILKMAYKLAVGLEFAHKRGVLHGDLKPANILVTDEGVPMLLDFNLARDLHKAAGFKTDRLGGTIPYMAPELLQAVALRVNDGSGSNTSDVRVDIYSFGMILYEWLSGVPPFAIHQGPWTKDMLPMLIPLMLRDRYQKIPSLRLHNPEVSPAVEAIVRKCMESDPSRRYASATELCADLKAQVRNRPLKHADNPSVGERLEKWRRRHPRWMVAFVMMFLMCVGSLVWYGRHRANLRAEAYAAYGPFLEVIDETQTDFINEWDRSNFYTLNMNAYRVEVVSVYSRYPSKAWLDDPLVTYLDAADRNNLRCRVGEFLANQAYWSLVLSREQLGNDKGSTYLRAAIANNLHAIDAYPESLCPSILLQRRDLWVNTNDEKQLAEYCRLTGEVRTGEDAYHRAFQCLIQNDNAAAIQFAEQAIESLPNHRLSWLILAEAQARSGNPSGAIRAYEECLRLKPDCPKILFKMGLSYRDMEEYPQAISCLTRAIERDSDNASTYFHRAYVYRAMRKPKEALRDLDQAESLGLVSLKTRIVRARCYTDLKKPAEARQICLDAMKFKPVSADDHVERAKVFFDDAKYDESLDSLEEAFQMIPNYYPALLEKVRVFHKLGENELALEVQKQLVKLRPRDAEAALKLAEFFVILGRFAEARHEGRRALSLAGDPPDPNRALEIAKLDTQIARRLELQTALLKGGNPPGPLRMMSIAKLYNQIIKRNFRDLHGPDYQHALQLLKSVRWTPEQWRTIETTKDFLPLRALPDWPGPSNSKSLSRTTRPENGSAEPR